MQTSRIVNSHLEEEEEEEEEAEEEPTQNQVTARKGDGKGPALKVRFRCAEGIQV